MPDSTLAGIITAAASVLTSVGLIVSAVSVLVPILRTTRQTKTAVQEVHIIVNQQRTDLVNYQRALVKALVAAGIDVPDDQSLEEPK